MTDTTLPQRIAAASQDPQRCLPDCGALCEAQCLWATILKLAAVKTEADGPG